MPDDAGDESAKELAAYDAAVRSCWGAEVRIGFGVLLFVICQGAGGSDRLAGAIGLCGIAIAIIGLVARSRHATTARTMRRRLDQRATRQRLEAQSAAMTMAEAKSQPA